MAVNTLNSAENRNSQAIPVLEYDFANGKRLALVTASASHYAIPSKGVYLIISDTASYISLQVGNNSAVGAADKSIFLTQGLPFYVLIDDDGVVLSGKAKEESGGIYVVKVRDN